MESNKVEIIGLKMKFELTRKKKLILIFIVISLTSNELYRYLEVKRLKRNQCKCVKLYKQKKSISNNPSSSISEFTYLYQCKDGSKTNSIYNIEQYIRPWEK